MGLAVTSFILNFFNFAKPLVKLGPAMKLCTYQSSEGRYFRRVSALGKVLVDKVSIVNVAQDVSLWRRVLGNGHY